ncbi:MAG: phosphatidylglycerophosphatase A [Opitutae bacterium]|nr:phosphatidylglycerophosphatase A [Opitutae bacterium]
MDWLVKNLSTLGPVGTKLPAPGTFGSLVGVIIFIFLISLSTIPPFFILLFFFLLFILGIPMCSRVEVLLGKADPPEVIWDEFTAVPLVYIFCINELDSFFILITGFALFRFFDIAKPFGIRKLQLLPGGVGVMIDDLAAALCSACLLYFVKTFALSFNQYLF